MDELHGWGIWIALALALCAIGAALGVYRRTRTTRAAQRQRIADELASAQAAAQSRAARQAAEADAARRDQDAKQAAERAATDRAAAQRAQKAAQVAAAAVADEAARARAVEQADRLRAATEASETAARAVAAERQRSRDANEEAVRKAAAAARAAALAPVAPVASEPPPVQTPVGPAKHPAQTLVLVADDSKVVRFKTGRLLGEHHYKVVFAIDGLDAVQQMKASVPDVVITDVEMPGMDGFQLTRHIRDDPKTARIPIIMITAAEDKHRADASSAGVSVLLGKPYADEDLMGFIRSALRQDQRAAAGA